MTSVIVRNGKLDKTVARMSKQFSIKIHHMYMYASIPLPLLLPLFKIYLGILLAVALR